jgi:murein DD-endopeptidase MepM/ murein hydrolase activator NlpD
LVLCLLVVTSSISYAGQSQEPIEIYYEEVATGEYKFYARNQNYAPYQIQLSFQQLRNMNLNTKLPYYDIIEPRVDEQYLFTAKAQGGKKHQFKYQYQYLLGNPNQSEPDGSVYLFPYTHGEKYKLSQGYNGNYSHQNTLALDFAMEKGTKIRATRDGRVVQIKEDSNIGGASRQYNKYANYITIYHRDGTFAKYVHLQYNGARVRVGDKVTAGQLIGYSGNTGWSQGPHLHFEVFKAVKMGQQTVATQFLNHNRRGIRVKPGKYYYAYQPGYGKFEVELGRDLTNSDYQGFSETVTRNQQLTLETEKVDDTVVLFVENGYEQKIDVEIEFKKASNITTSKQIPFSTEVPATTKIYAFLIKPDNYEKEWSYSIKYSYRK